MEHDIYVRQMKEVDLQAVYELVQNTIETSYHQIYPVEAVEFFKNHHKKEHILNDSMTGYAIIAESDSQILGTGTLLGTNIRRVFVNPMHQREGIGKLIVHDLERKAEFEKLSTLDLSASLVSRQFWEANGFVILKEDFLPVRNGKKLFFYGMIKTLRVSP